MSGQNSIEDRVYFARRALQELAMAERCTMRCAALVHLKLAAEYQRRAKGAESVPVERRGLELA
ncbi:hypothetical protein IAG41_00320 [Sphingomonas sp. JC676]|uniref:hypothetical protein n=1 Tax=Sphingomonas sp. JC676 TaxID=2768065 RepID=UPI001658709E|nr:hypothetical protein [Sphingomonas sp. JC676]MBC9030825.1 hypothetical protein [Sphingomonas sp. JC676]